MFIRDVFDRKRGSPLLLALGIGWATSFYGATYSLLDLGPLADLAGVDEAHPNAVGPDGKVVGSNALEGHYEAFQFDGAMRGLGTLGGGESFAADINGQGVVVGHSHTLSAESRGFIWTEGGTDGVPGNPEMRELPTFGGSESQALGINDSGHVTGYAETSNSAHAVIYQEGSMIDIGDSIGGLPYSFGFAINELGHVAGAAYNTAGIISEAFFYNGQSGLLLGDLGGGESFALGLNDEDHVVGYSLLLDHLREHAFRYSAGSMEDMGTLGGDYSYAFAINNAEEIVGGSFIDAQNSVYHAFIWRDGIMEDLNSLLEPSVEGWVLVEARAINDRGQIAGEGESNGERRAFLLTRSLGLTGPQIVRIELVDHDVLVTFSTNEGTTYSLETSTEPDATQRWSAVVSAVPGTGGEVTLSDSGGASGERRFYRVSATNL